MRLITRAAILLTLITVISACSKSVPPLEVVQTERQRPALILPHITKINTEQVKWVVVTEANVDEVFQKLKDNGQQPVLFALTQQNYENLGINQAEYLRLIREQRAVLIAYKNYYETTQPAN